jgi:transposase InsO family protein
VKFVFIKANLGSFAIRAICRVLDVSVSGYYAWLKRPDSARVVRRRVLINTLLQVNGLESSMSGKGDCWDNACAESVWATLKKELVNHEQYATRNQARRSIFEYIEVFYNRQRLHSSLGYLSPEAFEASLN